jgi:hypothetical protein
MHFALKNRLQMQVMVMMMVEGCSIERSERDETRRAV